MIIEPMRYAAAVFLLSAIAVAEEQKPACNAANHGRFWPEEANNSAQAAHQLSHSGELEMCSVVVWKYQWRKLTVNVRDLPRKKSARDARAESRKASAAAASQAVTEP